MIPLAWSLDHVGVLTRSVDDAALVMSVMAGRELAQGALTAPRLAIAPELSARASRESAAHLEAIAETNEREASEPLSSLDAFEQEARAECGELQERRYRRIEITGNVERRLQGSSSP